MFKVTDAFIRELLEATKADELKWDFENDWDDFYTYYKDMKLLLEHDVELSMCCDRLTLGVMMKEDVKMYSSRVSIDLKGNRTSNPTYDLLAELRKAAIAAKQTGKIPE